MSVHYILSYHNHFPILEFILSYLYIIYCHITTISPYLYYILPYLYIIFCHVCTLYTVISQPFPHTWIYTVISVHYILSYHNHFPILVLYTKLIGIRWPKQRQTGKYNQFSVSKHTNYLYLWLSSWLLSPSLMCIKLSWWHFFVCIQFYNPHKYACPNVCMTWTLECSTSCFTVLNYRNVHLPLMTKASANYLISELQSPSDMHEVIALYPKKTWLTVVQQPQCLCRHCWCCFRCGWMFESWGNPLCQCGPPASSAGKLPGHLVCTELCATHGSFL